MCVTMFGAGLPVGPEEQKPTEPVVTSMTDSGGRPCPRCDRQLFERHCKYVCPVHGVIYDCADTFYQ
jgi:hypothetical protein